MADDVVETPFGKFLCTPGDLIDDTLRAGTLWDGPGFLQPLAREHGQLGQPGVTILDVGAHHGAFSIWLASQGAWRVVAVEPVPQTMQRLKANLDLNKATCADRVVTLEVAGYSHHELLVASKVDPGNTGGTVLELANPEETPLAIQGRPLDDYRYLWEGGLSLIKIDAQGCDGRVLRGLKKTLERWHPAVVFEWEASPAWLHGDTYEETRLWLYGLGYSVHQWPSHPDNYVAVWQ